MSNRLDELRDALHALEVRRTEVGDGHTAADLREAELTTEGAQLQALVDAHLNRLRDLENTRKDLEAEERDIQADSDTIRTHLARRLTELHQDRRTEDDDISFFQKELEAFAGTPPEPEEPAPQPTKPARRRTKNRKRR